MMCMPFSSIATSCYCIFLLLVVKSSVSALNCSRPSISSILSSVPIMMIRSRWHRILSISKSSRLPIVTFAPRSFHALAVQCSIVKKMCRPLISTPAVRVVKRRTTTTMMRLSSVVFCFHESADGHFTIYFGQMAGRILIEWSMPKVDPFSMVMIIMFTKFALHHHHVIEANETFRCDQHQKESRKRVSEFPSSINNTLLCFFSQFWSTARAKRSRRLISNENSRSRALPDCFVFVEKIFSPSPSIEAFLPGRLRESEYSEFFSLLRRNFPSWEEIDWQKHHWFSSRNPSIGSAEGERSFARFHSIRYSRCGYLLAPLSIPTLLGVNSDAFDRRAVSHSLHHRREIR